MYSFSEDLFYKSFKISPCPMAISTLVEGKYIEINEAFCTVLGYSRTEVIGHASTEIGIWENPAQRIEASEILKKQGFLRKFEARMVTKDKTILSGLFNADFITEKRGTFLVTAMQDITVEKSLESEIMRLDNLNLIGQMAAGISHEIRNPMTTIRGYLQLLSQKPNYAQDSSILNLLISEVDRANGIISEFLSVARTDPNFSNQKRRNLNNIIEKLIPLVKADTMEHNCSLEYQPGTIPELYLNENEIRQLLLNLIRNGIEAMNKGKISIRTFVEDKSVILSIRDEGTGIPSEIISRLGTPFFTTKKGGTGLGLSICYGIALRHNAQILISTGQEGTTFSVVFPIPKK